jgi:YbbR domain-containing protein
MSRWFANNLGLIILAVLLAFTVWIFNALQEDPIVESNLSIPVVVAALDRADLVLDSTLPTTVTARYRAPQSIIREMERQNYRIPIDLAKIDAGEHTFSLRPNIRMEVEGNAQLLSFQPADAKIVLTQLASKTINVRPSAIGTPSLGYQAQSPSVQPQQVTVTATEKILMKIARIDAEVAVDGVRSNVAQKVRLLARDENGDVVSGVKIVPNEALVTVPIEQLSNYRDLAVRVRTRGLPSESYAVTSITTNPQIVTVFGNRDAIQQLPGYVETVEVSVDGATENIDQRAPLNFPQGITPVDGNVSVQVRVRVEAQQGARTVVRRPVVIGVTSDLTAELSSERIEVLLSGPLPKLNALKEDDVRIFIDVTGLKVGTHQVRPTIVKPDNIDAQTSLPTLQIELKESRPGRP